MKKSYIFLLIIFVALITLGAYFYSQKGKKVEENQNNIPYNSTRVSSNNEINITNTNTYEISNQNTNNDNTNQFKENTMNEENNSTPVETLLSEFTTKIYTKDKERQNNISITCSSLNNTTVNNSETFSFCNTVGKATTSKGYQKADVFKDGEVVQALGGGNCQVSTTLYNAVLKIQDLKVIERHEHSNSVPYITKGKDAAVAYGSYDFKFINNTGSTIKIEASCDKNYVYTKIFKIE